MIITCHVLHKTLNVIISRLLNSFILRGILSDASRFNSALPDLSLTAITGSFSKDDSDGSENIMTHFLGIIPRIEIQ